MPRGLIFLGKTGSGYWLSQGYKVIPSDSIYSKFNLQKSNSLFVFNLNFRRHALSIFSYIYLLLHKSEVNKKNEPHQLVLMRNLIVIKTTSYSTLLSSKQVGRIISYSLLMLNLILI